MSPGMGGKDQANHAEQAQQTWSCPQNRLGYTLSRRLESKMRSHLLEGGLDWPTGGKVGDDLFRGQRCICGVEVLAAMRPLKVVDENPADRHQPFARLVPPTGVADPFHPALSATVPAHGRPSASAAPYHCIGRRELGAFDARTSFAAFALRRQGIEVGISMKAADERRMTAVAMTEPRQLVGRIAAIAQKHELSLSAV